MHLWHIIIFSRYLCLNSSIHVQLLRMQAINLYYCCCVLNSVVISLFQFVDLLKVYQWGCRRHQELAYEAYTRIDLNLPLQMLTPVSRCHPLPVAKLMHFPWHWESILNCLFCFPAVMSCQI